MRLRPAVQAALEVGALLLAAAAAHGLAPTAADPDGYYHLRHAWVYRTQGLFDSGFPWAAFSAIRDQASDLWYGFHVLLVPATLPDNLLNGLLAGSVATTALALVTVWLAFRALRLPWPLAWVAAFAATGEVLFRLMMLRPQPLSLALALLLLAALATPEPRRGRRALVFGFAFTAAWIHIALAWLLPLVAVAFAAFALLHRQRPDWRAGAAVAAGTVLGVVLRPQPIGALRLAWIQIGLFLEVKARGIPLPFGSELHPLTGAHHDALLVVPALGLLAVVVAFVVLVRRSPASDPLARAAAWTSLALALLFTVLSLRVANRSIELAAAFAAVFAGLVAREHQAHASPRARSVAAALLVGFLAFLIPIAAVRHQLRLAAERPQLAFRGASAWLAANSRPGDLVFHAWWDYFPHLFFWNPKNRYLGGMDPLFQLAHDEALFWKAYWLSTDRFPQATCGRPSCEEADLEPTALVLRRDFGASYVIVHRNQNSQLDAWLASEPAFERVFDDGTDVLSRVQYDGGATLGGAR